MVPLEVFNPFGMIFSDLPLTNFPTKTPLKNA